jgi:hypothetical protein
LAYKRTATRVIATAAAAHAARVDRAFAITATAA